VKVGFFLALLSTTAWCGTPYPKAVVVVPVADLRSDQSLPTPGKSDDKQQTQLLMGEVVDVVLSSGNWVYVNAVEQPEFTTHERWEGYPGWVLKSAIAFKKAPGKPRSTVNNVRDMLVASADHYAGTPYVWGGLSSHEMGNDVRLMGMDCSGLTHLAYRQTGFVIPRDSHEQWMKARSIRPKDLKPGDLIFSGKAGNPLKISHVTLYAGDGQIIEAPQTGMVVRKISFEEKYGKPLNKLKNGSVVNDRAIYFGTYFE
jgi:hypothetical protein